MTERRRALIALLIQAAVLGAAGCGSEPPPEERRDELLGRTVDTAQWLRPVPDPPWRWRRMVQRRDDVVRARFVRFERPDRWPSPESRFVFRPFADTRLELNLRRAGPTAGGTAYSWFGTVDGDPLGWGGVVARPNGRIAFSLDAHGRRYEIINVDSWAYAVLELEPRERFECGTASSGGAEG